MLPKCQPKHYLCKVPHIPKMGPFTSFCLDSTCTRLEQRLLIHVRHVLNNLFFVVFVLHFFINVRVNVKITRS